MATWVPVLQESAFVLLVAVLGMTSAAAEVVSRYRDEPLRALLNRFGGAYLALNALVAVAAYGLLLRYNEALVPGLQEDRLLLAILAGFSAILVLRSNLLILKAENGQQQPIGPAAVVEAFLGMLDRSIDRQRASERQRLVAEHLGHTEDFDAVAAYFEASLLSYQNLGEQEKRDLAAVIEQYRQHTAWPLALRTMAIGFAVLTIAGQENFEEITRALKAYLAKVARSDPGAESEPPSP